MAKRNAWHNVNGVILCTTIFYTKLQIFLIKSYNVATSFPCVINLVTDIDDWLYQMVLCDAEIEDWAFKRVLSQRNSKETKCYSIWARLKYRGNTLSKPLSWPDECRPRFYLGKDEVGCGNTPSLMHGSPAARMLPQMGQYFQAVL